MTAGRSTEVGERVEEAGRKGEKSAFMCILSSVLAILSSPTSKIK